MFTKTLEEIFSLENLKTYGSKYDVEKISEEILSGKYIPNVIKRIYIPKSNNEKRPIGILDERDKFIQKVLYDSLNEYFDKTFSNHSYGYRPQKGTIKAIKRVRDYINRKFTVVYRSDFDNFFETINHNKLIEELNSKIEDKRIVNLLAQFIKNGLLEKSYMEHNIGVHQGDVLSPLLSNIYLDKFDKFLEENQIEFVRFADDFVLLFKKQKDYHKIIEKIELFVINELELILEKEKSYFSNISKGFTFLGCYFRDKNIFIDNDKFYEKVEEIKNLNSLSFEEAFKKAKDKYEGFIRYYQKVLTSTYQIEALKNIIIEVLENMLIREFENNSKKSIIEKYGAFEMRDINIKKLIIKAYDKYKAQKSLIPENKIKKQKRKVIKNLLKSSIISIHEYGVFLGISKNKITIKQKGKIKKTFPKSQIKRIIINSKGVSFSSDFIYTCSKNDIAVEFIGYDFTPYAVLVSPNLAYPKTYLKQLEILASDKRMIFAKEFVRAKLTNQKNYLRYLNKYHKVLQHEIENIKRILLKVKTATKLEEVMGYEGIGANAYWQAIGKVLKDEEFRRITKGASDTVNSAFNYGYAILYNRIKSSLVKAGLGINISFLHSLDKKPVLAFDFIEEFRTFIVDRAIIFALNKSDDIKVNNEGRLTKEAKKRIIEEVNERFSTLQTYKGKKISMEEIIQLQAYYLARCINENKKYKSFIARF